MDISTVIIIGLVVLLYLAVGFVVALVHYLGPSNRTAPTGLKAVFLAPFSGVVWLVKKF